MATIEERYKAATDYVRRAIRHVETGAFRTPMSLWFPGLAAELAGGQVKTEPVKNELARLEARWLRTSSDLERARAARDAELLADRVQENLPGAPQDRQRTNLYAGEQQSSTAETTYGDAVSEQAGDTWDWVKETASEISGAAQGIGQWLLIGGGILLGIKTIDYLREREREHKRNERAASVMRRRVNAQLVDIAEARNAHAARPSARMYSLQLSKGEIEALRWLADRYGSAKAFFDGMIPLDESADATLSGDFDRGPGLYRFEIRASDVRRALRATKDDGGDYGAIPNLHSEAVTALLAEEWGRET